MDGRDPSSTLGGEPGILDRARGMLLGLAVGDALGSSLEFGPRVSPPLARREMVGGGPFDLEPGEFTDDTAMALALGKSLVACRGFDPRDVMDRFLSWWRTGEYSSNGTCFDIGGTTSSALARYERSGNPFAGSTAEHTAANGSIMRLAPVVAFTIDAPTEEAVRIARDQSRLTHAHPACLSANEYLVQLLRLLLRGETDPLVLALPRFEGHPGVLRAKSAIWGGMERRHVKSTGGVVDTLEAALFSCANAPSFEHAVTLAVNCGGDSDTVGAVAGTIAGAKFGAESIPKRWLEPLAKRNTIGALALSLVRTSSEVHIHGA